MVRILQGAIFDLESCPSGRRGRFAKPLYGIKPVPRVRIPHSPFFPPSYFTTNFSIMNPSKEFLEFLILEALKEANIALQNDEVPIGAVIAKDEKIIGRGSNSVETDFNATSHAEIKAITNATNHLNNWRLDDCILAVTIEPCTMCAGAILQSRIPVVVFGAPEPRTGAYGSVYDLSIANQSPRVVRGVMEDECRKIIQDYFKGKRNL